MKQNCEVKNCKHEWASDCHEAPLYQEDVHELPRCKKCNAECHDLCKHCGLLRTTIESAIPECSEREPALNRGAGWEKIFREFHRGDEFGSGSWLVGPSTVRVFIAGQIEAERKRLREKIDKMPRIMTRPERVDDHEYIDTCSIYKIFQENKKQ